MVKDSKNDILLKPFQNKKGQKNLRDPTKKRTAFLSGTSNFFGLSYFETALVGRITNSPVLYSTGTNSISCCLLTDWPTW